VDRDDEKPLRFDGGPSGAGATGALAQAGLIRIDQFSALTEAEVSELHGMEPKAFDLIRLALAANALTFSNRQ
jgi:hypothetical protein